MKGLSQSQRELNDIRTYCLTFCQTLTTLNHKFTINLSLGKDVTFNFCNKEPEHGTWKQNKKLTPCQERRRLKRRENFLQRKSNEATEKVTEKVTEEIAEAKKAGLEESCDEPTTEPLKAPVLECDQCDYIASGKASLSRHVTIRHKYIPQIDGQIDGDKTIDSASHEEVGKIQCKLCPPGLGISPEYSQHIYE